jgi:hypothetical protein
VTGVQTCALPIFKPQSDVLFNILYTLGFNPNIQIHTTPSQSRFQTIEEAVTTKLIEFDLIGNQSAVKAVKNYMEKRLVPDGDSFLLTETFSEATIWWKPQNEQNK